MSKKKINLNDTSPISYENAEKMVDSLLATKRKQGLAKACRKRETEEKLKYLRLQLITKEKEEDN